MPLRAVSNTSNVHAFKFDGLQWAELKVTYRTMNLRMPCCDSQAIPKTSSLGNNFFAHARKGNCTSAPESAEHLYCKQLVAQAALRVGWSVHTEWRENTPDGDEWIADVFCQRGSAKIAFEIQISPQTHEETLQRQARYRASGVRGAWFYSSRIRQGQVAHNQDTPAFVLSPFEVGHVPLILGFNVPLPEFVAGMLTKRLIWHIPEYSKPLHVEFMNDNCWACQQPIKQVYGYLANIAPDGESYEDWHERAFTVATISKALEAVFAVVSNEELRSDGLNPIGKIDEIRGKPTSWPYCNQCMYCGAPQNNFHIGEKLREIIYGRGGGNKLSIASFDRKVFGTGRWMFLP